MVIFHSYVSLPEGKPMTEYIRSDLGLDNPTSSSERFTWIYMGFTWDLQGTCTDGVP
jgi:hypothetical protein